MYTTYIQYNITTYTTYINDNIIMSSKDDTWWPYKTQKRILFASIIPMCCSSTSEKFLSSRYLISVKISKVRLGSGEV